MSYYPEPDSDIRDKRKVVLDLSYYGTKKYSAGLILTLNLT